MTLIIRQVRGADFRQRVALPAPADSYNAITCQARCLGLAADLDVRALDDSAMVEIHAPAAVTAGWPLRLVACDLRLSVGGEVAQTETFLIHMLPEVTGNG
jgi:hypothetical protein